MIDRLMDKNWLLYLTCVACFVLFSSMFDILVLAMVAATKSHTADYESLFHDGFLKCKIFI